MSRRGVIVVVAVLAVAVVALAVTLGFLLGSGGGASMAPDAGRTTEQSPEPGDTSSSAETTAAPGRETEAPVTSPAPAPPVVTESETEWVPAAPAAPAPPVSGPTFVECLFGTPGPARFSDGSIRNHPPCSETPEAQRSLRAESVCGGLYGWQEVSRAEYIDLCGVEPPTG